MTITSESRLAQIITRTHRIMALENGTKSSTMIVQEFVNFLLVAKFHTEHASSHPQTPRDYVLSSWLRNSIFFVFIGEV